MEVLEAYGRVHRALHGRGGVVVTRILTTCEQMLRDRGCDHVTRAEHVLDAIREGSPPVLRGRGPRTPSFDLYLLSDSKVSVKAARAAIEARGHPSTRIVIVSVEGPTPFTRKECDGKGVQFFLARDLCVNITRHQLVPRHALVPHPPEGCELEHLPEILDTDPVVQYYGWNVGDVVKIRRLWGGQEPTEYYRLVASA